MFTTITPGWFAAKPAPATVTVCKKCDRDDELFGEGGLPWCGRCHMRPGIKTVPNTPERQAQRRAAEQEANALKYSVKMMNDMGHHVIQNDRDLPSWIRDFVYEKARLYCEMHAETVPGVSYKIRKYHMKLGCHNPWTYRHPNGTKVTIDFGCSQKLVREAGLDFGCSINPCEPGDRSVKEPRTYSVKMTTNDPRGYVIQRDRDLPSWVRDFVYEKVRLYTFIRPAGVHHLRPGCHNPWTYRHPNGAEVTIDYGISNSNRAENGGSNPWKTDT